MVKNTNFYLFTFKQIFPILYVPGFSVKVLSDISVKTTINQKKLPKDCKIYLVNKALEKLEINPNELKLYKALSLYLKYHRPLSNIYYFSKIGFYIGWIFGFLSGLYLTKLIAIFIGNLNLTLVMLLGVILGLLVGLKVKNLPLKKLVKKDFRYTKITPSKNYKLHNRSMNKLNRKEGETIMKNVCVFIGATIPQNPKFLEATLSLGKTFAERNVQLVYGGAKIGLMGQLADAVLSNGGSVIGVMATVLKGEITHDKLTHLYKTNSLQDRKAKMANLSDGFIAMPGGLGTLEEMFEVWNALKIGASKKPLGLLNIDGYFDCTIDQLERGIKEGLVSKSHLSLIKCSTDPATLLDLVLSDMSSQAEEAVTSGVALSTPRNQI